MKKVILTGLFLFFTLIYSVAQKGNVVLIEEFTETGCGACSQYDSSFQALTNANAEKVVVINYHCFYALDTFYTYYMACDKRSSFYNNIIGYPSAIVNGQLPEKNSSHISYVNQALINKLYDREPQFKFDISSIPTGKGKKHSTSIRIKATALKAYPEKDLKLFIAITENNIDHEKRYNKKAVNGVNNFNHILRAHVPGPDGFLIGSQLKGKVNKIKASYSNDDKEIDYKEVRIVVYIQDMKTKEILGAATTKNNPF